MGRGFYQYCEQQVLVDFVMLSEWLKSTFTLLKIKVVSCQTSSKMLIFYKSECLWKLKSNVCGYIMLFLLHLENPMSQIHQNLNYSTFPKVILPKYR